MYNAWLACLGTMCCSIWIRAVSGGVLLGLWVVREVRELRDWRLWDLLRVSRCRSDVVQLQFGILCCKSSVL